MTEKNDGNTIQNNQSLSDQRIQYLIEMIGIKMDKNMTGIYSAFYKVDSDAKKIHNLKPHNYDNYI